MDRGGATERGQFTVNAFDATRSAIAPRARLALSGTATAASADSGPHRREIWPWVLGVALLVLCCEWWVYHRAP